MAKASKIYLFSLIILVFTAFGCKAQTYIRLVDNHQSGYKIILPEEPSKTESAAAALLQRFLQQSTGAVLPIIKEGGKEWSKPVTAIYIGQTRTAAKLHLLLTKDTEAYRLFMDKGCLFITGGQGHATEYAVYYFAENFLNGHKLDQSPAIFPGSKDLQLPDNLDVKITPAFKYRESYYPQSLDAAYLHWHGLQQFEDLWGLWGHTYNKLLPPAKYFKSHPEYYALVNGARQPSQLCLSNPKVLASVIDTLKTMMADNPDALYWSVAPNDDGGYCTCDQCLEADREEGGHQGSLIRFVNKVAAAFPDKEITTLAYQGTAGAPLKTRARSNVVVLLSSIDVFRDQPLRTAGYPAAVKFRQDLSDWSRMSDQVFLWDYCVQFTNYLSPFPDLEVLADNFKYFRSQGVKGIFEQGSGDSYSDGAELNSFVQAKLLWNPELNLDSLVHSFCTDYYGAAAASVLSYLKGRAQAVRTSGRHLDIYGNPLLESRGFLSAANMVSYQKYLDEALEEVKSNPVLTSRVKRLLLSLTYVTLQQARFYGLDPGGFLEKGAPKADAKDADFYVVRPGWAQKVADFVASCQQAGVKELAEGGLSPATYAKEWQEILGRSWPANLALHAKASFTYPFSEDYPARGAETLTDGMAGFDDFSYNWLCFYGVDLEVTLDLGAVKSCGKININFLDDPRHWIFLPSSVQVKVSADGKNYSNLTTMALSEGGAHTDIRIVPVEFTLSKGAKLRYIKVLAVNPVQLPAWRNTLSKKPMIAADEIRVTP